MIRIKTRKKNQDLIRAIIRNYKHRVWKDYSSYIDVEKQGTIFYDGEPRIYINIETRLGVGTLHGSLCTNIVWGKD